MLTSRGVERAKHPGRYSCGLIRGLYLQITPAGSKSYVLRYQLRGQERWMGLGGAAEFTLSEARARARAARQLLADRIDPLVGKQAAEEAARLAAARKLTFREAAERYFDQHAGRWRPSHRDMFLTTLRAHAFPTLGAMDVASIDTPDILRTLEPIWKKTKSIITADRVRGRIEAVLDWATVSGHRPAGTNPAKWKGHLDQVLPAARKLAPVVPLAAMSYRAVPAFMTKLRALDSVAARALEFLILTAARAGEVIGARWSEIDLAEKTWTVPKERMKSKREHRVALSPAAISLLQKLPRHDGDDLVFGGLSARWGMRQVMERLGQAGVATVHGFRSAFSTWAHEQTAHAAHTIEISLAHNVGTETARAYRRSDLIAKRAQLMQSWATYCLTPSAKVTGEVVPLRSA
jgi:integrase